MGDSLPPKKQLAIERIRRRFELYRRHQEEGFPRHEAAANGLYEQQKQETLLLRQRFLESKAKKAKKGDHKNAAKEAAAAAAAAANNGSNTDNTRSLLAQKLNKRSAPGGSPLNINSDNIPDENDRAKIPRTSGTPEANSTSGSGQNRDQKFQQQSNQQIPSFSVQIVQQFTSSASPQSQHSQTIQTNVTVKALPNSVKTSNSPLSNLGCQDDIGTSISVGTNFECKRERETDLGTCGGGPAPNQGAANSANQATSNPSEQLSASDSDRFAETLANLGFPDDSNDEIHPDILNDLFDDDIFTNSTDLMKDFNFEEAVAGIKDVDDSVKDLGSLMMEMDRVKAASTAAHQQQMQNFQFNNQSQLFDNQGGAGFGGPRMNFNPVNPNVMDFKLREPSPAAQTLKQMAEQHQSMQQKQMGLGMGSPHHHHPQSPFNSDAFDPLSSLRTNFMNNGSPAPGLSPLSKGPPTGLQFGGPPFGQQTPSGQSPGSQPAPSQPPSQPTGAFSAGLRPTGVVFKQEVNTGMYPGMPNSGPGSCKNPMVSGPSQAEMQDMRNRQAQQMQRITPDQKPVSHLESQYAAQSNTTGSVGSPVDQKPNLTGKQVPTQSGHPVGGVSGNGPGPPGGQQQQQHQQQSAYASTRPLSHFTDPISGQNQGVGPSVQQQSIPNRNSPVSVGNIGGQFMRGGSAAGMTPSPPISQGGPQGHFSASPGQNRPSSGPSIHMSQTQQLQINQGNQQLQVSQSQQLQMNQDIKPQIHPQSGPNQPNQSQVPPGSNHSPREGNLYNYQTAQQHQSQAAATNQYQLSMAQSQSVSFGGQYVPGQGPNPGVPNMTGNLETPVNNRQRNQRQAQFMGGRPPPEYKPQPNFATNKAGGVRYPQNARMVPPYQEAVNPRGMAPQTRPQGLNPEMNPYQNPVGQNPNANVQTSQSQTKNAHAPAKSVYTSALSRNRAPNVNVGPEGLNISQRPPVEWRQMFQQQAQLQQQQHQQQHQIQLQQQQMNIRMQGGQQAPRFPSGGYRQPQPNTFNNVVQGGPQGPGPVALNTNNLMMGRGGHHPGMAQMQHVQQQIHQQAQHNLHMNHAAARGMAMTRPPRQRMMTQQQHVMMRQALDNSGPQGPMMNLQMASSQQMYASVTQRVPLDVTGAKPQDQNANTAAGTSLSASDTGQFNLDFLDSIEPTTSDLLNFDNMGAGHFSILDDM